MRSDTIDNRLRFAVLLRYIDADRYVRTFQIMIQGLTDIMNQAAATCQVDIDTQFGRHNAGQLSHLNGVTQYVLTVTGTIP